jgi:tetratricopeptide (TPR) repeat protein
VRRVLVAGLIVVTCGCVVLLAVSGRENKLTVLKRAARLAEKSRYASAVEAYRHYIELVGDTPETAYERAEAYYQIGRLLTYHLREPERGRVAFEKAAVLRPDYAEPQLHLGIMYMEIEPKLPDKAEAALRRALESRPELTEYSIAPNQVDRPRVILAELERRKGHLNEAIRQLYIHEHYSEYDASDWHELGRLFASQQEQAKALFYYKRAFETLTDAERGMPPYMALRNDLIGAYIVNGYVARADELLDESFDVLGQFENMYRALSGWHQAEAEPLGKVLERTRPQLLRLRALVSTAVGDYNTALDALRECKTLVPTALDLVLDEARLLAKKGEFKRARDELAKYRRLAPHDPEGIMADALIAYEEGDHRTYLRRVEEYILAAPGKIRPRALRALALVQTGRTEEGLEQLEAYCRAEPNFPQLQLKMAQALAIAGRTREAIWWIRRVAETDLVPPYLLETEPTLKSLRDDPGYDNLLRDVRYRIALRQQVHEAEDLVYRDETSRGLGALERIRQQNPDIAFTTYALARAYVFVGDHDKAFPLLVECAQAGYFSAGRLRRDIYVTELHNDPRFDEVIEAIEQPWPEQRGPAPRQPEHPAEQSATDA